MMVRNMGLVYLGLPVPFFLVCRLGKIKVPYEDLIKLDTYCVCVTKHLEECSAYVGTKQYIQPLKTPSLQSWDLYGHHIQLWLLECTYPGSHEYKYFI